MNPNTAFERDLELWLAAEAPATPPAALHSAVLAAARARRQRPIWLVALRGGSSGLAGRSVNRPASRLGSRLIILAIVAALLLALVVGALLAGGLARPTLLQVAPTNGPVVQATPSPALARNGVIVYSVLDGGPKSPLEHTHLVNADGSADRLVAQGSRRAFSRDGSILAYRSGFDATASLVVAAPDGTGPRVVPEVGQDSYALSPDGTRVAWLRSIRAITAADGLSTIGQANELWVTPLSGGTGARIVPAPADPDEFYTSPVWSADAREIVFEVHRAELSGDSSGAFPAGIDIVNVDGSGLRSLTTRPGAEQAAWSPDGRFLAYVGLPDGSTPPSLENRSAGPVGLYVVGADGSHDTALVTLGSDLAKPAWSPDGARLGYLTFETGLGSVVTTVEMDGANPVTAPAEGSVASSFEWSPDGTTLVIVISTHTSAGNSPQQFSSMIETQDAGLVRPATMLARFADPMTCPPSWQRLSP